MKYFAVTDIESKNWTEFLCIGIYDGEIYKDFTDLDSYFEFLFYLHDKKGLRHVYAHFGGIFDFLFLISHCLDNPNRFITSDFIPRGSSILTFKVENNKRKITFHDSSALLPFSLKSISENFNVETKKGSIDYEKIEKVTPELLEYMKDDHLALYQCLEAFGNWEMIKAVGLKQTLASQALEVFRKIFYRHKLESLSKINDDFCRKSYMGGRTEIFKPLFKGNKNKKLYYYDVNSLYPYIMQSEDMPIKLEYYTNNFLDDELGIYHCRVKSPDNIHIPILGTKNEYNQFIFPIGEFDGYWCSNELNFAIDHGYKIIEVYKGAIFTNGGKIFRDYVEHFYKIRNQAKINNKPVDNVISKLLLNSLYGRFGLDTEKEQIAFESGEIGERHFKTIETAKGYKYRLVTVDVDTNSFNNVAIASFITAYARIHLYKQFKKVNYEVYYCDTDSLFTTVKMETSDKLGDLKLEYELDIACFLLPKTYLIQNNDFKSVTMKGFDKKKIQHFTVSDFMTCLEGDLRLMNKNKNNPLTVKHDMRLNKFKTAIQKGKLLSLSNETVKRVSSKYDKRIIYKKGKEYLTKPIKV